MEQACEYFDNIPLDINNPCTDDCDEELLEWMELAFTECCPLIDAGACDCDVDIENNTIIPEYEECTGECG